MRTLLAALAWLVAVVAAVITVPTLWIATHVADEQGYVDFTRPFVDDTELQKALAAQVSDDVGSATGLPDAARAAVAQVVAKYAAQLADDPGFVDAWEDSQRRTHRLTFDEGADRLTVDVGPVASFVVKKASGGLPVPVDVPSTLKVPVYDSPDPAVLERVSDTQGQSTVGLVVAGAAALLCLVLARRRGLALAGLGVGALLVAGVLRVATGWAVPEVLDRTPARTPFAREMRDLLVDRASDSLNGWLLILALVGLAVTVAGLLLRGRP
jgi:hypothetical protein